MSWKFRHPSTIMISGPTGSGKTKFVERVLVERLFSVDHNRVFWVYSEWQPAYESLQQLRPDIMFKKGLGDENEFYNSLSNFNRNLVILDDQMSSIGNSKTLSRLFTEGSHHRNLSIIYIVQNLFDKGRSHRTVSLNAQYFVLFKNPRDKSQIDTIARQMYPGKVKFLRDAFQDATKLPFTYLIIDMHPETNEGERVLTQIFAGETPSVYQAE